MSNLDLKKKYTQVTFEDMILETWKQDDAPNEYNKKFKKYSFLFYLNHNKVDFINLMMIINRRYQHLGDGQLNDTEQKARDSWIDMYGRLYDCNWDLTKNYIAILAIILTSIGIIIK